MGRSVGCESGRPIKPINQLLDRSDYTCVHTDGMYIIRVYDLGLKWLLYETQVLVLEGELIMGHVDKKTVGSSAQGLIHISWLEKGWDVTRLFMNMVSQEGLLRRYWLLCLRKFCCDFPFFFSLKGCLCVCVCVCARARFPSLLFPLLCSVRGVGAFPRVFVKRFARRVCFCGFCAFA